MPSPPAATAASQVSGALAWRVARFAPSIIELLREQPKLSTADILRRIRLAGYHGGKSALYELVRRLRTRSLRLNRSGREHPRERGE